MHFKLSTKARNPCTTIELFKLVHVPLQKTEKLSKGHLEQNVHNDVNWPPTGNEMLII